MSQRAALPVGPNAASALGAARRVVVKIGSSLLIDAATRQPTRDWLAAVASDLAALKAEGREVIVVSSGSIALGRGRLPALGARLEDKQAAASVGQSLLMAAWSEALAPHGLIAGQVLLTRDDTERRRRWLNARATVEALLTHGVIPIVNENDTVATEEIRYGDNDRLAARTAQLARADLLILLSDVDGLYTADPRRDPNAAHLPLIETLSPDILAMGGGANADAGVGTGGMATKLAAAQIARSAGCATIIASGQTLSPLSAIRDGARATLIAAPDGPMAAYKQWIAGSLSPTGVLTLDAGAVTALKAGKSLLPAGVTGVSGAFEKGDCVRLIDPDGCAVGVGLAAYAADEAARLRGRRSDEIETLLGYRGASVLIHRDDMVLDDR
ncbi:MAG: glutamate 5-kinase [Pseudomonadota bacterium]|uniref:glutamate 5-kinase n=1 Tax=Brevundimonas sp. 'scallop' TaxID=2562582 RepID=UPI0013E1889D|nr:glutamate 5-kinase [Brevundimonas sp. 'scallop']MEE2851023.1 glutamate 5-kinase [Pseudomonadota bacterium]QIF82796.1 glutamate 5-kinase [Brevundimonas sp. 'scallop']